MPVENWMDEPEDHDYPAAADYLDLVLAPAEIAPIIASLRDAPVTRKKAKDLLRASGLPILDEANAHVRKDLDKVKSGKKLSPVLLVRGRLRDGIALTIADGYHRVCASYQLDEDALIPCKIVSLSGEERGP
jgi:hypothetical protein